MDEKITIVLAEDQELMRKSLISLLGEFTMGEVIGEAANGKELLDLLKKVQPDIVLMDIEMPVMNGLETLDVINRRFPGIKVIMLSMHDETQLIYDFMMRGARGYLPKGCDVDTLFSTLLTIKRYGYFFNEGISKALLAGSLKEKTINPLFNELSLSSREVEVLKEICEGKTNKEIARSLRITARTVDFHRGNLYQKTNSSSVADLVKFSIRNGYISID